jgi:hypothetical protein
VRKQVASNPENGGDVPPKRRLKLNGLHGVISQKIMLFIITVVKTSNPTWSLMFNLSWLHVGFMVNEVVLEQVSL